VPKRANVAIPAFAKTISSRLFLALDLREKAIQIGKARHVSLYTRHISSDLLHRGSQLRITARRYEDVRAFVDNRLPVARPIPLLPPVMSTIFPSSLPILVSPSSCWASHSVSPSFVCDTL
jgi:hypothetical protein